MSTIHDDSDTMPPRSERSIAGLFGDLAHQSATLFRQEIELARAELATNAGRLSTCAVELLVGSLIVYAGFLALLVAAGLGLALLLQPWAAAAAVGSVTVAVGAVVVFMGKRAIGSCAFVPERTLRSLRSDASWVREQMR